MSSRYARRILAQQRMAGLMELESHVRCMLHTLSHVLAHAPLLPCQIVVLAVPLVFGFAIAMHVLGKKLLLDGHNGACFSRAIPNDAGEYGEDTGGGDTGIGDSAGGGGLPSGDHFAAGVIPVANVMLEIVLGGASSRLDCMRQVGGPAGWSAYWLQFLFLLIAVVLLLNMVSISSSCDCRGRPSCLCCLPV